MLNNSPLDTILSYPDSVATQRRVDLPYGSSGPLFADISAIARPRLFYKQMFTAGPAGNVLYGFRMLPFATASKENGFVGYTCTDCKRTILIPDECDSGGKLGEFLQAHQCLETPSDDIDPMRILMIAKGTIEPTTQDAKAMARRMAERGLW